MDFKIRKVKLEEIDKVSAVTAEAYTHPYDIEEKVTSGFMKNPELGKAVESGKINILVALVGNRIVGAVRYAIQDKVAHLSKLAVLKDYRNKGIAAELVNKVEFEAKNLGATKVTLDFMQEKNLQSYYEKLEYKITEIKEHGKHHDVFAEKTL
ncbi:GNAT family N-acetyltransferase [Patescibacteria group bacterium]|nr:GNAT family N-acetyltransferase [Patescibacteria group bacterium]